MYLFNIFLFQPIKKIMADETSTLEAAAKSFLLDEETDTPAIIQKQEEEVIQNNNNEEVIENTETITNETKTEAAKEEKTVETKTETESTEKKSWRQHFEETDEFKERKRKEDEAKMTAQMESYSKWENSEIGKLWLKAEAEGKSMYDVVNEFQYSDVTKLSDEQKFIKSIENLYANDENKEDLLKEQWELFNQKPDFEKRKELQSITNELLREQQEKISKFTPQQKTTEQKIDPKEAAIMQKASQELDSYLDSIVKTEVNGIKMTPVRVEKINDVVLELPTKLFRTEAGTLDMKKAVAIANFALYGDVMVATAKKEAKTEGKVEVLTKKHNQSANNAHNLPIGGEKSDSLKAAAKAFLEEK
jgi:hypothetical protein